MTAIREFVTVNNHMLSIKLPDYFNNKEVEVVIMPKIENDDLSYFSSDVEMGMNSPVSEMSHEEIFKNLKDKYAD